MNNKERHEQAVKKAKEFGESLGCTEHYEFTTLKEVSAHNGRPVVYMRIADGEIGVSLGMSAAKDSLVRPKTLLYNECATAGHKKDIPNACEYHNSERITNLLFICKDKNDACRVEDLFKEEMRFGTQFGGKSNTEHAEEHLEKRINNLISEGVFDEDFWELWNGPVSSVLFPYINAAGSETGRLATRIKVARETGKDQYFLNVCYPILKKIIGDAFTNI